MEEAVTSSWGARWSGLCGLYGQGRDTVALRAGLVRFRHGKRFEGTSEFLRTMRKGRCGEDDVERAMWRAEIPEALRHPRDSLLGMLQDSTSADVPKGDVAYDVTAHE